MFNFLDWLAGGNTNVVPQNPMQGLNLLPPMPLQRPNPFANMGMGSNPVMGSSPIPSVPAYAQAAGIGPNNMPPEATKNPAAQKTFGSDQDSLRKMLMMQALMGDEGMVDPANAISGGLPSGAGMKGGGGFQNDPNAGLLNSFPPQMPQRKRFIGSMGGGY